ncbi:MAG TPA: hypothetical protein VIO61_02990 [Anaerolineaceae bacterium]
MAKIRYDGIIEAVRFTPTGQVALARAYERRGPTYSDIVLLSRSEIIGRLKAGKKLIGGKRVTALASTFEPTTGLLRLEGTPTQPVLRCTDSPANPSNASDDLPGIPIF